jgi:integrase
MVAIDELLMYAFVAFWIIWVAVRRKEPGRWLIKFCEGPLMTFATFMDWNVMRMAGFFVWLSRNPAAALRIKGKEMKLKVEKPSVTPERAAEYERELEETRRRQPIREPMVRLNIGTAMLLVLLFIALYLIAMFIRAWFAP